MDKDKTIYDIGLGLTKKSYFFYQEGMQKNQINASEKCLNYVSNKFEQSIKSSLMADKLIVIEVDERVLLEFNTKQKNIDYIEGLELWEQEDHETTKDGYLQFS